MEKSNNEIESYLDKNQPKIDTQFFCYMSFGFALISLFSIYLLEVNSPLILKVMKYFYIPIFIFFILKQVIKKLDGYIKSIFGHFIFMLFTLNFSLLFTVLFFVLLDFYFYYLTAVFSIIYFVSMLVTYLFDLRNKITTYLVMLALSLMLIFLEKNFLNLSLKNFSILISLSIVFLFYSFIRSFALIELCHANFKSMNKTNEIALKMSLLQFSDIVNLTKKTNERKA